MKVLIIDDSQKHLITAQQTLAKHDVTVCSTHDEARRLLYEQKDEIKFNRLREEYDEKTMDWGEFITRVLEESTLPYWDVVLCDLMMPAGENAQGSEGSRFVGEEMSVGWSLALSAVMKGAKFVAVITDMNHHNHPASAMLDSLNHHIFNIDGAKMLLTNRVDLVGIAGTECSCEECSGSGKRGRGDDARECYICDGTGTDFVEKGKNWGEILTRLINAEQ